MHQMELMFSEDSGSILGAELFLRSINNVSHKYYNNSLVLFADQAYTRACNHHFF